VKSAPPLRRVDLIIGGGTVLTMDPEDTVVSNGAVAIRDGAIVAVGARRAVESRYHARRSIDARGRLILPGFVNAHTHAPMTLLRGAKDAGHEVVVYELNELDVKGCQGCRYCKDNDADCILEDGLKPYWKDLHECGALIVSAPNYCSQVCGPSATCKMTCQGGHCIQACTKPEGCIKECAGGSCE
jgi:hypothetical protein